jgi:hypothetical protein
MKTYTRLELFETVYKMNGKAIRSIYKKPLKEVSLDFVLEQIDQFKVRRGGKSSKKTGRINYSYYILIKNVKKVLRPFLGWRKVYLEIEE